MSGSQIRSQGMRIVCSPEYSAGSHFNLSSFHSYKQHTHNAYRHMPKVRKKYLNQSMWEDGGAQRGSRTAILWMGF